MYLSRFVCVILILLGYLQLNAAEFEVVKGGPLHEAYVVQEEGTLFLHSVPTQPPLRIKEESPSQEDDQMVWIPGYWAWSQEIGDFLWVSGVWRKPPPDHEWIAGYWKKIGDGWVWFRGFWSKAGEEKLSFIQSPPPDPIDEDVPELPSSIGDYFWVPGHWQYKDDIHQYVWLSGRWTQPSPHWIYVPPQYYWREKGYIMNPAFWDWPLDTRGLPFAAVYIRPDLRDSFTYKPTKAVQHLMVMQQLFPYWPNYSNLFRYAYFFHHEAWKSWGATPPWWDWPAWWSYTWQDSWWLWWWWTHSGFPNPSWINQKLASTLTAPPPAVKKLMSRIQPPPNVTANGVVGNRTLLDALIKYKGVTDPILPADPKQILQIQELAKPQTRQSGNPLVPQGIETIHTSPPKVFLGKPKKEQESVPEQVTLPPTPSSTPKLSIESAIIPLCWEPLLAITPRQVDRLSPTSPTQQIQTRQQQQTQYFGHPEIQQKGTPQTRKNAAQEAANGQGPNNGMPPAQQGPNNAMPPAQQGPNNGMPPGQQETGEGARSRGMGGEQSLTDEEMENPEMRRHVLPPPMEPAPERQIDPNVPNYPTRKPAEIPRAHSPIPYSPTRPERPRRQPDPTQFYLPQTPRDPFGPELDEPLHPQEDLRDPYSPSHNPAGSYSLPNLQRMPTQMQTQHHDYFMTHPQPQINPGGPKAHQTPGDYSTLPQF